MAGARTHTQARLPPAAVAAGYVLVGALLLVPAAILARKTLLEFGSSGAFSDFRGTLWDPGHAIRAGHSPYPPAHGPLGGSPSDYPPFPILVLGVPLSLLPFKLASAVWGSILAGCVALALRALGVRDWRCYAVALLSFPVLIGVFYGNATLLVLLLVALGWRYRDDPWRGGLAIAAAVAMKLFALPLFVWLAFTRRFRAFAVAAVSALVVTFGCWAAIGFDGLRRYPHILSRVVDEEGTHGVSVYAFAARLGTGQTLAQLVALLVAVAVLVHRRGRFDSAIFASLVASSLIWEHYFSLLFVVAAIAATDLSWTWLLPVLLAPAVAYVGQDRPLWLPVLYVCVAVAVCRPVARDPELHPPRTA
jgi:hypothetical protein